MKKSIKILPFVLSAMFMFGACTPNNQGAETPAVNPQTPTTEHLQTKNTLHKVTVTETNKPFVVNGESDYKILVPFSQETTIVTAANYFAKYIKMATGCQLPVEALENYTWNANEKWIVFGRDDLFAAAGLTMPTEDIGISGYYIKSVGNSVFVAVEEAFGYKRAALSLLDHIVGYEMYWNDMLDKTQMLPFSHRHFSHLMCLYPLHLLNYDTEEHKRIYRQTIWNMEQLGEGWWIGFSFAWSAQLYAMMYNGNAAYEKLRTFARGYVSQNGFHLSGDFKWYGFSQWHYRPFTLESIFGFCDALQEMLLQEHQGYIHVFPAIPDDWKEKVSFKRLRSYQGVLVSAQLKDGKTQKVVLESRRNVSVQLFNSFDGDVLIVKHGKTEEEIIIKQGEKLSLNLRRGKTIVSLKK